MGTRGTYRLMGEQPVSKTDKSSLLSNWRSDCEAELLLEDYGFGGMLIVMTPLMD